MSTENLTITNVDKLIATLYANNNEIKRWVLGKYSQEPIYCTDLTKSVPIYNGERICHKRFNFTQNGTRCPWCNSFCLLTDDGEIVDGQPIKIQTGSMSGQKIVVNRSERQTVPFGSYKPDSPIITSHLSNIQNNIVRQRMINKSCDASHYLAISSLINTLEAPYKCRCMGGWVCDRVNIVKIVPNLGDIYTINFTPQTMKDIFLQMYLLASSESFNHGSPSTDTFSFNSYVSKTQLVQGKIYNMNITLLVEPDKYSSFFSSYNGRNLYFVGKDSKEEIVEPNWNIEYRIGEKTNLYARAFFRLSNNPCMSEYVAARITTFKPTHELINFIRQSGLNPFPPLNLFLYLTILLTNRSFYDAFCASNFYLMIYELFTKQEADRYFAKIRENFGKHLNADEVVNILISADVKIRIDSIYLLGSVMGSQYV